MYTKMRKNMHVRVLGKKTTVHVNINVQTIKITYMQGIFPWNLCFQNNIPGNAPKPILWQLIIHGVSNPFRTVLFFTIADKYKYLMHGGLQVYVYF